MADQLRLAVIGAGGFFDRRAAQPLHAAANVELHSMMVRDQSRAEELARKHGAQRAFATVDAVLDDPDVDAVYLVTPVHTHLPQALAAARAGKHVLCEKPMAMNAAECSEMIEACRTHGVHLMPAFMSRFHTPFLQLRERLADGGLGKIVACRCRWGGYYPPHPGVWRQDPTQGGGGPLMDVGSHAIDLLRFLVGEITEVAALSDTLVFDYGVEDTCTVLLRFASGAQGLVESHWSAPRAVSATEVLGSQGVTLMPHVTVAEPIRLQTLAGDETIPPGGPNRYTAMFEHFADACLGRTPLELTGEDGLRNSQTIDAAYRSARERAFVSITP